MTKKAKPKPDDKAQSKRFVETAKELEADASGKKFERAFDLLNKTPKKSAQRP